MSVASVRPIALETRDLCKHFSGLEVLKGVSTAIRAGEVRAVIGPNGAGKTTFINVLTGIHPASSGRVFLGDADVTGLPAYRIARKGLSRTFQISNLFADLTVLENAMVAVHAGRCFRQSRDSVDESLSLVGLSALADRLVSEISHGDQKLLEIAIATACGPDVLLLDEPTAGMSPSETNRFIDLLNERLRSRYTIVIVEHDMNVVMNTADVISVLALGVILAEGKPDEIRTNPGVQEAYLGSAYA
jgi:branched-chain amino acid transport system ATP-binding protein